MKRILSLLSLLLFITACDDGNLTVDEIDFSDVPVQKCSDKDLYYKIKDDKMLFIEIPASTFTENETLDGAPIEVQINSTNKVTYRRYAGTVTSANICGAAPDVTTNLVEQWNATSGIIQIIATAIKTTNATDNSTRITGYTYNINFKNIIFQKPDGPQGYGVYPFGNYTKTVSALAFGFNEEVDKSSCSTTTSTKIYDFSGGEVFTLDVADFANLFASTPTPLGTPRTVLISATNKLSYRLYSNAVNDAYFCGTPNPTTTLLQQWDAVNGIEATSGIIEVTTTTLGAGFQHTIHLKKVTLKKGNSTFSLGDDYLFGTLVTTN